MEAISREFERQIEALLEKQYPAAAGLSSKKFLENIEPLADHLKGIEVFDPDLELGRLPFVLVIKNVLVDSVKAMSLVYREGKCGIVKLFPHEPKSFEVVTQIDLPVAKAYLLLNVDRGKESLNLPPCEAIKVIAQQKRSALTIDEGIACITQYPDFLRKNNCFSLLASRHSSDKRVPAIWINANKNPNLGWCWDGNPHTWLGSASCEKRLP